MWDELRTDDRVGLRTMTVVNLTQEELETAYHQIGLVIDLNEPSDDDPIHDVHEKMKRAIARNHDD